jgi:hypothetical protein
MEIYSWEDQLEMVDLPWPHLIHGGYLFSISVFSAFDHERDIPKVPVVETY